MFSDGELINTEKKNFDQVVRYNLRTMEPS